MSRLAAPSVLGYALLELLARAPCTGYELTQTMDYPVGHVWAARHSQIYPTLIDLEARGLVRHRVVAGRGPRDTKRYTVTAKGKRALVSWVGSPFRVPESRNEFLLRVRALWLTDRARALELVRAAYDHHRARLAMYQADEARFDDRDRHDPKQPGFTTYATLRAGIGYEQHMVAWCEWMLASLD